VVEAPGASDASLKTMSTATSATAPFASPGLAHSPIALVFSKPPVWTRARASDEPMPTTMVLLPDPASAVASAEESVGGCRRTSLPVV
jgi:hypothetical protein